jgi:hypothetical protein
MNTNEWITKMGGTLEYDVSGKDAFFRTLTGLDTQQNSDVHGKTEILRMREKSQKEALKEALQEWHAGYRASQAGDENLGKSHRQNAMAILFVKGYPMEKFDQFMALANKGKESIVDSVNWSLYTKGVSPEDQKMLQNAYTRMQQIKQGNKK